jgi:hypothetical protein
VLVEEGKAAKKPRSTMHILWRICQYAPHKDLCGAYWLMWRILAYAPQKCVLILSGVGSHKKLCGAYTNMRHRSPTFCGACWHMRHRIFFIHVQYWTPRGPHRVSVAHPTTCAIESHYSVAHQCFMRHRNWKILWSILIYAPPKYFCGAHTFR